MIIRCTCVSTLEALSDYAEPWEELRHSCQGSVFTSYPLVKTWLESFGGFTSPRVLVVDDAGEVVGIAPLCIRRQRAAGVPIKTLTMAGDADWRLGLSSLNILFEPERIDVTNAVLTGMRSVDWNMLRLRFMEDCPAARSFIDLARTVYGGQPSQSLITLECPIPETGDVLWHFGKNYRKNIHQRLRRLEQDSDIIFRSIPEGAIDRAVDTYARQHVERWAAKGGSLLRNPENVGFLKTASKLAVTQGFGYAYELVVDGQVAAQRFGYFEGETAWAYMVGMNDSFARYSPGLILLYYVMEDLQGKGFRFLNLGEGAQEHKYHLGAKESSLIGWRTSRGAASVLSKLAEAPVAQRLERALGIKSKLLGDSSDLG